MNGRDAVYVSNAFHNITDLEGVGDYAENIVGYAEKLRDSGDRFSETAVAEVEHVQSVVEALYAKVIETYRTNDRELLKQTHAVEQEIDDLTESMASSHIQRLADGVCTVGVGAEFLAMASDIERIADHFYNVAKTVKEFSKVSL